MWHRLVNLVIGFTCLFIFLIIVLFTPHRLDRGVLSASTMRSTVPDYEMQKLRYVATKGLKTDMEVFADQAKFSHKEQALDGLNVSSLIYDEDNNVTKVKGDTGFLDLEKSLLTLEGNVLSRNHDGFQMETEQMFYHTDTRLARSDVEVFGYNEERTMQLWGDTAESDLNSQVAVFRGNAKAYFDNPENERSKIRGDVAFLRRGEAKVDFLGNVLISEENLKSESKRAEVFYGKQTKTLKYMVAYDDVIIRQENGRFTQSQTAEFFAPTDTVVLTGFPSYFDGADTVNGDRMVLHRSTGVLEVTEANAAFNERKNPTDAAAASTGNDEKIPEEDLELVIEEE